MAHRGLHDVMFPLGIDPVKWVVFPFPCLPPLLICYDVLILWGWWTRSETRFFLLTKHVFFPSHNIILLWQRFHCFGLLYDSKTKLEVNCDFSSNDNVWTSFVAAILNFVGLFLLWKIDWNFVHTGFLTAILNWNLKFRLQNSDFKFQKSEVPIELWYFYHVYIDIYLFVKWKHIQRAQ